VGRYRFPILDRNQEELAVSITSGSIYARPKQIKRKQRTAWVLSRHLGESTGFWLKKLRSGRPFIWLQRQAQPQVSQKIAALKLPGVYVEQENKRVYPNGTVAANILGFTDIDGKGISGVELSLNDELIAEETKTKILRDGKGNASYIGPKVSTLEEQARSIYLTIDRRVQHAVEELLAEGSRSMEAKSLMAIVMDPYQGEIYALAQYPSFDPNKPSQSPQRQITNQLISHLYEPGSTMKVILAAQALQMGLFSPHSQIDCGGGKIAFGDKVIREAEIDHNYETLPFDKVICYSSNIGAIRIAEALGTQQVRSTIDQFGLTAKTGISLPGEISSLPKDDHYWLPIFLATTSFGQGISTTPIQMLTAFAPFANGGYLTKPRILMRETFTAQSNIQKRILTPSTVEAMRKILLSVTSDKKGTGISARVPGIEVAGKTGTAQKYDPTLGYNAQKYFSSFLGFLPAEKPELLIGVWVDEPKWPYYSSQTAAPLFSKIAHRSMQILGRFPQKKKMPKLVAKTKKGRKPEIASATIPKNTTSIQLTHDSDGHLMMPDLKGLSMRQAIELMGKHTQDLEISGSGFLATQMPSAGSKLGNSTQIKLGFTQE